LNMVTIIRNSSFKPLRKVLIETLHLPHLFYWTGSQNLFATALRFHSASIWWMHPLDPHMPKVQIWCEEPPKSHPIWSLGLILTANNTKSAPFLPCGKKQFPACGPPES
jgi:hypothetical protein